MATGVQQMLITVLQLLIFSLLYPHYGASFPLIC